MNDSPRTDLETLLFFMEDGRVVNATNPETSRQIERELNAANERIRILISERDSARQQADQNWRLREEFQALLGTDDVAEGVKRVKEQQERIKRLLEAGDLCLDFSFRGMHVLAEFTWAKAK